MVLEADARRFADTMKIPFFETSAKENFNVEEVLLPFAFCIAFLKISLTSPACITSFCNNDVMVGWSVAPFSSYNEEENP